MMRYIEGEVIQVEQDGLVLKTGGVGYFIYTVACFGEVGNAMQLWLHDLVREDKRELYGFVDKDVLHLFEKLISISGIGHKMAQKILMAHKPVDITQSIVSGDIPFLTSLPGIGKKTAQKIVLELKGVLVEDDASGEQVDHDALEALESLGYAKKDAHAALKGLSAHTTETRIRQALKLLSNHS